MSFYSEPRGGSTQDRRARGLDDSDAEFQVLSTDAGRALLAEVSGVASPGPSDIMRWRKNGSAEVVAAAVRLAACRRKSNLKFSRGDRMWLDPVGLEQATPEPVAANKAARFGEAPVIVDFCAGIGGDALALAAIAPVLAVDRDRGMCRRVAWNARIYGREDRILACQASAESFPIPDGAWVHVDPDRRTSGRGRAVGLEGYAPGPDFLRALIREAPGGAIKLGPASDFDRFIDSIDRAVEVEIVSSGGEAKEATIWFGAAVSCERRATKLPENVSWTDRLGERGWRELAPVSPVAGWLYDPDPALTRSGLLDSFAQAHGLARIAADLPYLTADARVETPWLEAFEVQSAHPLDLKRLRRLIDAERLGPLTIKHKTTDLKPEALRRLLRSKGDAPTTLFLTGGRGPGRAIVTRPARTPAEDAAGE